MSEQSVNQLVTEGEFRKVAEYLDAKDRLTVSERVLRAAMEFHLGDPCIASAQAKKLLTESLDPASRVQALEVYGRSLGRLGAVDQGIAVLQKAVSQATTVDPRLESDVRAHFVQDVLSWIGIEPALPELPRLRESALRAGNPHALAHLHIAQARIAALRGVTNHAYPELERAERLLKEHRNADISWLVLHVRTGIASIDGYLDEALRCARATLESARLTNAQSRIAFALGNLANALVWTGQFEEARACLNECLDILPRTSRARLAALHTGIHLGLLTDDSAFSKKCVDDGLKVIETAGENYWYYRLWFELHRGRWLLRTGKLADAITAVNVALGPAARLADKELHDRLSLLAAEAHCQQGEFARAAELLNTACATGNRAIPSYLIELYRVAAVVAAPDSKAAAGRLLKSAQKLISSTGLIGLKAEVDQTATHLALDGDYSEAENRRGLLDSVGLVLKLGGHPWMLGAELVSLLQETATCSWAYVTEEGREKRIICSAGEIPIDVNENTTFTVGLGTANGARYMLSAPAPTPPDLTLWTAISQILRAANVVQDSAQPLLESHPNSPAEGATFESGLVVLADKSHELLQTARKLAPSNITVLITGETGTGKELFARALHDSSPRSAKPFIPFNCSAVSREMLDAQLFGYRKGSFTGATDAFQGVIRAAAGGTLFLDEIGEIALDVQPKLLRFLESGEIHPLGESRPLAVDVRVVAATNADLEKMVEEGRFREDLFYRLNVVRLHVPPLRERREEIPPLVQHYLDKCSRESHKAGIRLADETMEYLILFKWPGNVRQLANEVRRMVALAESGAVLMPEHLSHDIASSRRTVPTSERLLAPTEFVVRMDQPMSAAIDHLERSMIQYALKLTGGRMEDAAERLGLSRKGLYLKRQRLALQDASPEHPAVSA